jgi:hypothetical protein
MKAQLSVHVRTCMPKCVFLPWGTSRMTKKA